MDTFREWVADLQELATVQRELVLCSRKQVEIGDKLFAHLEEKLDLLEQKAALLSERIAQYEIAFSAQAVNDVRRLN
ncbi:hypothetical protein HMF3257_26415 [Spirosoma telluris]|uniref:Uncharacterized protein n=1 Tax=Spirosoma telluris TaxID=2183553 RepID=A0A327NSM9_9BACT|nr:hypothetical protein HMF3257_26415 [Spirosoma telluris]